jgi:hypothetical protein
MKKIIASLCIIAIFLNVFIGMYFDLANDNNSGNKNGPNGPGPNYIPTNFTVTVPDKKIGDEAKYEYTLFAEMYSENKTSGEWERYTLTATGTLIDEIAPVSQQKDGFNRKHSIMNFHEETLASFLIRVDGSDSEPMTAHGNLDITRDEYTDLNERKVIQTKTSGNVYVEPLPNVPKDVDFHGKLRNYPNPNEEQEKSLDEMIYLGNKELKLNDSDSILKVIESEYEWVTEWYTQRYNWTVEGSEHVAGYDTLIVNVSTGFFQGYFPFYKKIWIANEASFPVKLFTRTNTSFEDEKGRFYIILEHSRKLLDRGFTRGDTKIPWGDCTATTHFHTQHPQGEFKDWDYMPISGAKYDQGSFNFKPEAAEQFASANSEGLKRFMNQYDDVVITWGGYKEIKDATDLLDPDGKAGKYNWNLTFGYKPTMEEIIEAWEDDEDDNPKWAYYVNMSRNVSRSGINQHSEFTKIINQGYPNWGSAELSKSQLSDETCTLASSETIFKLDKDVKTELCGERGDEIEFNDELTYGIALGAVTSSNMPGMNILETITGITMPTSKYSWSMQSGQVFPSGSTFSAALDAESGQLLFVLEITGTELYGIFG